MKVRRYVFTTTHVVEFNEEDSSDGGSLEDVTAQDAWDALSGAQAKDIEWELQDDNPPLEEEAPV